MENYIVINGTRYNLVEGFECEECAMYDKCNSKGEIDYENCLCNVFEHFAKTTNVSILEKA